MATMDQGRRVPLGTGRAPLRQPLTLPELVKFVALAALLAMFADAAVAHAMLWGNDPYWTYWVTDTLLMTTVFGVGTAWFGVGLKRGAVLTFVHILLLTTYYWTLSPIGLPGQPEWLDLERTWITGLPVHFGVYYLGYTLALWLWDRSRRARAQAQAGGPATPLGPAATLALVLAVAVVVVLGLLQTWLVGQFPGLTWFIVRTAVLTPLILLWWALAGTDRVAAVSGGVMLGFALSAYGHYLSPVGLPNPSLRLFAENPPPAVVEWLSYREEFLLLLPVAQILAVVAMLLASRWYREPWTRDRVPLRPWSRPGMALALAALLALGAVAYAYTGPQANRTTIQSVGPAAVERGVALDAEPVAAGSAELSMTVENRNTHRTELPPHDGVQIQASVAGADGRTYTLTASRPMVAQPQGRHTTWAGVGFDKWHHGRSGIGTSALPATRSDVAVYALGELSAQGSLIVTDVPVHVMTSSRSGARLELHVGDPEAPIAGLPGGHLRAVWADYSGGSVKSVKYARYAWGTGVLLVLLGFALAMARRAEPDTAA
ncbi:hypothetical protein [Comamonas sp. NLF-1-9]|uniref:hypothetical protein n=1 Tax=Comamonas sp. NLF-1-9 TaxID=2853163 RepID=UPI001C475AE1|nr:hypothetical protein [Comamonas sp. NLF-1-9]QXL83791.1 hypothetical protein KUD94_11130 [Comamonas sp. NLF-1-9]